MIQVDTLCHKIPRFIEKAKRAGVTRVFIGLENINPGNLLAVKKRQNKIAEYRKMLLAWKAHCVITLASLRDHGGLAVDADRSSWRDPGREIDRDRAGPAPDIEQAHPGPQVREQVRGRIVSRPPAVASEY